MSTVNKAGIQRYIEEVWNKGNLAVAEEVFAPTFVDHDPRYPGIVSLDHLKQFFTAFRAAFPDLRTNVEDLLAEGDKVLLRYSWTGTHKGEFLGIAPTGKRVMVMGLALYRFADGKVVEAWANADDLGLLRQLGVVSG